MPDKVILLVDSDANSRVALQSLVRQAGYRVFAVATAAKAIDHLYRNVRPNLILLDLRLPDKGGSQLVAELQGNALFRDIPIIVISGGLGAPALPNSVSAIFEKPIDDERLLQAIARFV